MASKIIPTIALLLFFMSGAVSAQKKCTPSFPYKSGWLGADAAYSIPLSSKKDLWIFQDTFVGEEGKTSRKGSKIIPNSLGVSTCIKNKFEISYFWRNELTSKAYFDSKNPKFKYWPVHGFVHKGKIYIFLLKVAQKSSDQFGFKYIGVDVAIVSSVHKEPKFWNVEIKPFSSDKTAFPGIAVVVKNENVFLFTVLDGEGDKSHDLILTRLKLSEIERGHFSLEQLSSNGNWEQSLNWKQAKRVLIKGSTELSVHFDNYLNLWLAVHSEPSFPSKGVVYKSAKSLLGPWTNEKLIFNFLKQDKDDFCYAAKAHPQFSEPSNLLFTYVCNSFDFAKQVRNMKMYRPLVGSHKIP